MHAVSKLVPSLLILTVLASTGWATTWRVDAEGTGDTPTIQAAIDSAASGDTVLVAAGTYGEFLVVEAKGIVLRGDAPAASVILEGSFAGRLLSVTSPNAPVVLENLTFQHGRQDGIEVHNIGGAVGSFATRLAIRDCIFLTNVASGRGGAVFASSFGESAPGATAAVAAVPPFLELARCLFSLNFCGGDGGGLYAEVPTRIEDCAFRENTGGSVGGGAALFNQTHLILRTVFERNNAPSAGGIHFSGDGTLHLEETLFDRNLAEDFGGGLYVISASGVDLVKSWFVGNRAAKGAGARFTLTPVFADRVLWRGNVAEIEGGAIYLEEASSAAFTANTWIENDAAYGASYAAYGGVIALDRSILGDPFSDAGGCLGTLAGASCVVAAPGTGACPTMSFVARVSVEACEAALDSLCPIPSPPSCGPVGHTLLPCAPGCAVPARPLTWGRLKELYR